jgi:hypothetical protein
MDGQADTWYIQRKCQHNLKFSQYLKQFWRYTVLKYLFSFVIFSSQMLRRRVHAERFLIYTLDTSFPLHLIFAGNTLVMYNSKSWQIAGTGSLIFNMPVNQCCCTAFTWCTSQWKLHVPLCSGNLIFSFQTVCFINMTKWNLRILKIFTHFVQRNICTK